LVFIQRNVIRRIRFLSIRLSRMSAERIELENLPSLGSDEVGKLSDSFKELKIKLVKSESKSKEILKRLPQTILTMSEKGRILEVLNAGAVQSKTQIHEGENLWENLKVEPMNLAPLGSKDLTEINEIKNINNLILEIEIFIWHQTTTDKNYMVVLSDLTEVQGAQQLHG
jgi:diphthamide synthase (EF-2-diphthine--ammonia ligase)